MLDKNAKWIWINNSPKENEYAVFEQKFEFLGKICILQKIFALSKIFIFFTKIRLCIRDFLGTKNRNKITQIFQAKNCSNFTTEAKLVGNKKIKAKFTLIF